MHRNSQWEDEVIDLENQITHLLNQLEAAKTWHINQMTDPDLSSNIETTINELSEILGAEQ